ncbi:hypothetical protein ACFVR6_03675 [Microbacterium sp. NPDC058021]|uniref:hypothetical protein n=1 Tax=Microbacterium sp. NPDC058021 TaxID=3346306 RepID=UPI0036D968A1
MDPFASATLMQQRTQGEITSTTHPYLVQELEAASRAIRNFCRWHVAKAETLTYQRSGRFEADVWLPAMEISSITKVTLDGVEWTDLDAVEFDGRTGWTNLRGRRVEVEYVAGYIEVPADIEMLTLELAAGGLGTALNISREQAGGVAVTYSRSSGAMTALDEGRLVQYRLGRVP